MPGMRKPLILLASRILGIPFAVKLGYIHIIHRQLFFVNTYGKLFQHIFVVLQLM